MTLIDRQIEVIARACAVSEETVRAVVAGQRVDDVAAERVRAALSLIRFIPPIPRIEAAPREIAIDPYDTSTWPDDANREDVEADEAKRRDDNGPGF